MTATLLAAESGGGFDQFLPPIEELFDFPPFLFDGTIFAMNRTGMLYLLAAAITIGLTMAAFSNAKIVPGNFQAGMEGAVEFVRNGIIGQIIGPQGNRYLPLLFSLFLFILINNLFEVIPFINFPTTSRMAVPAMLAVMVYVVFILVGIKAQGPRYFWNAVAPPGVPWYMLFLIVPIEFVSTFLLRPFTLAVRLFANLMAGHILLTVVFLASSYNLVDFHSLYEGGLGSIEFAPQGAWPFILGILIFIAAVAAVAFEIMVGALQAYIFTMLAAVYIGGAISPEH